MSAWLKVHWLSHVVKNTRRGNYWTKVSGSQGGVKETIGGKQGNNIIERENTTLGNFPKYSGEKRTNIK